MAVFNPQNAIPRYLVAGETERAAALLLKSKARLSRETLLQCGSMIAMAGHPVGMMTLLEVVESAVAKQEPLSHEELMFGLGAVVQYHCATDTEQDGIEKLSPLLNKCLKMYEADPRSQAFIYNMIGKLHAGARDFGSAVVYQRKAVVLDPDEPTYAANLSSMEEALRSS